MITEKRIAEIRESADITAKWPFISEAELLQLVECYEANMVLYTNPIAERAAGQRQDAAHNDEYREALTKLWQLFHPEAGNG